MKNEHIFNRLFILGGIELTEDDWRREFSPHGRIIKVYITKDHSTGKPKGRAQKKKKNAWGIKGKLYKNACSVITLQLRG